MNEVLVLGGGAAGLVAAWRAALRGHRVTLLEANAKVGVKLRISGGGKCNVTHAGSVEELAAAFPRPQARFLRPALHAFTNDEVVGLLREAGVETYVRDNGRVFPLDRPGSAAAVVDTFRDLALRAGVELRTGCRATGLEARPPRVEGLRMGGDLLRGEAFILATGGASYPRTGTLGEVAEWLRHLGVPVRPWFPALAPIPLESPVPAWEGVALRGGTLRLTAGAGGRRLASFSGDVVFTREGLSGPAALELSREAEEARRGGEAWLSYDFLSEEEAAVDRKLRDEQARNPHRSARTWLHQWLPERVAEQAWRKEALPEVRLKQLERPLRKRLVSWLLAFPLGPPGPVNLERGEVSAGGVELGGVDPRTMRLRGWENLQVCGELLDVDGPIGGYNLQAAFSTGFLAGEHAGR